MGYRGCFLAFEWFHGGLLFLSTWIPVFIIDRVGRRPLMFAGAAGMGTCMIVMAVTVHEGTKTAGKVAASMLFLFLTFFSVGWLAM